MHSYGCSFPIEKINKVAKTEIYSSRIPRIFTAGCFLRGKIEKKYTGIKHEKRK